MMQQNTKFRFSFILILGFFISFLPSAQAATTLQISFLEVNSSTDPNLDLENFITDTNPKDSKADKQAKSDLSKILKSKNSLKSLENVCRRSDYFGAKVKVTNGNGGTAGLGNLNSLALSNLKVVGDLSDLPYFTEEEEDQRNADKSAWFDENEDADYWPDPDFIEGGYRNWRVSFDCLFSSKVAITNSNFYTIFIDGGRGPEYSRAELIKRKWKVTLVDDDD
jgi:hypothetical protein